MLNRMLHRLVFAVTAVCMAVAMAQAARPGQAPPGFTSGKVTVNDSSMLCAIC